jgi:hypothetical protein
MNKPMKKVKRKNARSKAPKPARVVQIAVGQGRRGRSADAVHYDVVYALDTQGRVWMRTIRSIEGNDGSVALHAGDSEWGLLPPVNVSGRGRP